MSGETEGASGSGSSVEWLIGTAGWSYDDWTGTFFPRSRKAYSSPLAYYSRFFNHVEINATFYRVMPPRLALKWCEEVKNRADFRFSVKLWRGLTHERPEVLPRDEIGAIREMCERFIERGRFAVLLVQFPWSFRPNPANYDHLARVLDAMQGIPAAVEMRHSDWATEGFFGFLRERGVAFCNIDQPTLRDCLRPTSVVTAPFAYLRFHGRNAANWFLQEADTRDQRYDYYYEGEELDQLEGLARDLAAQVSRVMVTGNNHFRGQAAANALSLRARLEGQVDRVPPTLREAYPDLSKLPARHIDEGLPRQPDLFGDLEGSD